MPFHPEDHPEHVARSPESECGPDSGEMFQILYAELRVMAQRALKNERARHSLNATALVHEVYVKLSDHPSSRWHTPAHFCALAAQAMRRVLVDHARNRGRIKRGGKAQRVGLTEIAAPDKGTPIDVLVLDEALTRLADHEPDAARVVEMRFFAGLEEKVVGEAMGVTERTVRRHWTFAKAWLYRELDRDQGQADRRGTPP